MVCRKYRVHRPSTPIYKAQGGACLRRTRSTNSRAAVKSSDESFHRLETSAALEYHLSNRAGSNADVLNKQRYTCVSSRLDEDIVARWLERSREPDENLDDGLSKRLPVTRYSKQRRYIQQINLSNTRTEH